MSLIDTTTFIRMFCLCHAMQYLCQLVGAIGILWHTHTQSLWNLMQYLCQQRLLVDYLWITQGFLWIKGHGEGPRDTLDLVVPSGIQKRVKLGYMYKPCEYL